MNQYPKISEGILGEHTVPQNNTERFLSLVEQYFPAAVKDGEVDFTALKEEMGEFAEVGTERYAFTWAGKQAAKKEALSDLYGKTLHYMPNDSLDPDTTGNIYIEGDNLEALKLMSCNYHRQIKMIYIDPPYNTGKDFIYHDNYSMTQDELAELSGDAADGVRYRKNTKDNGIYHTAWLNMMYPRLKIARELLSDDGVIFVSIDDNEVDNLSKIMSEIFDERNFICKFIWKSKLGKVGTTSTISAAHEYILCYAKNCEYAEFKMIKNISDGRKENLRQWGVADRREDRPSMFYPIHIDGIDVLPIKDDGTEGRWRVGEETARNLLDDGLLELSEKNGKYNIYRNFPPGVSYTPYDTMLQDNIGTTAKGAAALKALNMNKYFDFSKPVELIYHFAYLCTKDNDIILDFFSGSAASAHAVMQLNADDGKSRKFIMVQLPEPCNEKSEAYKAGFKNICEIGKERIRRAAKKIHEDKPDSEFDGGFKVFRVGDTNIRWKTADDNVIRNLTDEDYSTGDKDNLDFTYGHNDIDIVYEIMLRRYGTPLSTPIVNLTDISPRTYIFDNSAAVCLEPEINDGIISKLAALDPTPAKFILRDSAFGDDIELKDMSFRKLSELIRSNQTNGKRKTEYNNYTVEFI